MALPKPKAKIDELQQQILAEYSKAWQRVQDELASLADDPSNMRRAARLQEVSDAIQATMDDVDEAALEWVQQAMPKTYMLGAVDGSVAAGGTDTFGNAFTQIAKNAVQNMVQGVAKDLLAATDGVKKSTKEFLTRVAKDEELKVAIDGKSWREAAKVFRQRAEENGIYAVKYANGAKHGLEEYAHMTIRTRTAVAYNAGSFQGAAAQGVAYWECFDGPDCGWTYHEDPELASGRIVTQDEGMAWPISHPNCRRTFGPRPDIVSKKQAETLNKNGNAGSSIAPEQVQAQRAQDNARLAAQQRRAERIAKTKQKLGQEAAPVSDVSPDTFTDGLPDKATQGWLNGKDYYAEVQSVQDLIDNGWDPEKAIKENKRQKANAASKLSKAKAKLKATGHVVVDTAGKVDAKSTSWADQLVAQAKATKFGENAPIITSDTTLLPPGNVGQTLGSFNRVIQTALPKDTPEGVYVPVYQAKIAGVTVNGWAARRNGIAFFFESPSSEPMTPELKAIFEKKINTVLQTHNTVPAIAKKQVNEYHFFKQRSPLDEQFAKKYNTPNFKAAATGGNGETSFWDSPVRPGTILHEMGHSVDKAEGGGYTYASSSIKGALTGKGGEWQKAIDNDPLTGKGIQSQGIAALHAGQAERGLLFGEKGVTDYGATNNVEDFAESFRLYMQSEHDGYIALAANGSKLTFRDVYPERAKRLDAILGKKTPTELSEWEASQRAAVVDGVKVHLNAGASKSIVVTPTSIETFAGKYGLSRDRAEQFIREAVDEHEKEAVAKVAKVEAPKVSAIAKTKKDLPKNVQASIASKKSKYKAQLIASGTDPAEAAKLAQAVEEKEVAKRLEAMFGTTEQTTKDIAHAGSQLPKSEPRLSEPDRAKASTWLNKAGKVGFKAPDEPTVDIGFKATELTKTKVKSIEEIKALNPGKVIPYQVSSAVGGGRDVYIVKDKSGTVRGILAGTANDPKKLKVFTLQEHAHMPESKYWNQVSGVASKDDTLFKKIETEFQQKASGPAGGALNSAGGAKENLERELARRLDTPEDWAKFRKYEIALNRGDPGEYGSLTPKARQQRIYNDVYQRVSKWAGTSGNQDLDAVTMQMAVKDEFKEIGVAGDPMPRVGVSGKGSGGGDRGKYDVHYSKVGDWYRTFARRQYELTQDTFKAEGVERVSVYRGMGFNGTDEPQWLTLARGGSFNPRQSWNGVGSAVLQPANSWSTRESVSKGFQGYGQNKLMLEITVPVEYVLGSARTGFGCLNEAEFVLLHISGEQQMFRQIPTGYY